MAMETLPIKLPPGSAKFVEMQAIGTNVSVVVPCFRSAHTIRRAVQSVARQTLRPVELILVDDASDDDTPEILEFLRSEFGNGWLQIVTLQSNRGPANARNIGWDIARGEFIALLDADDEWLPLKIERQCAFMGRHREFSISGHLAHYGSESPRFNPTVSEPARHCELSRSWILVSNPMVTPSFMFRRDLRLRFCTGSRHMEDHRFLQEALFSGLRAARLEEALVVVHKPAFGVSGLSAALWQMELGELDNYRALLDAGHIQWATRWSLVIYSMAKFLRRVLITRLRKTFQRSRN